MTTRHLDESGMPGSPLTLLRDWVEDARSAGVSAPELMTLATADADGVPAARTVVMSALREDGIEFHSSTTTQKARHLQQNPKATAVLRWDETARQVVLACAAVELAPGTNDLLFAARPRELQLLAWLYEDGQAVSDRHDIDRVHDAVVQRFGDAVIPRPRSWTGFRLVPHTVDFWQRGAPGRPNERVRFSLAEDTAATTTRKGPATWRRRRLLP